MFVQPRRASTSFQGYAVEFSPFQDNLVAVGTSQYFGIIGNGRQYVYELAPAGELVALRVFDTREGIYDCAWSERHPQQLLSACANGSIKLWHLQSRDNFPIQKYHEHTQEVAGVNWNLITKDMFCSASWDTSVKIWNPEVPHSLRSLQEHTQSVYNCVWNPHEPNTLASCSSDGSLKLWDLHSNASTLTIAAHPNEVLALDWNKYNPFEIVSGSTDCSIKVWDLRQTGRELNVLLGHEYGIRRLKCSPHDGQVVASVSYDMTASLWNTQSRYPRLQTAKQHTEFVFGIDFSLFVEGLVATCSWDRQVCCWNYFGGAPMW